MGCERWSGERHLPLPAIKSGAWLLTHRLNASIMHSRRPWATRHARKEPS